MSTGIKARAEYNRRVRLRGGKCRARSAAASALETSLRRGGRRELTPPLQGVKVDRRAELERRRAVAIVALEALCGPLRGRGDAALLLGASAPSHVDLVLTTAACLLDVDPEGAAELVDALGALRAWFQVGWMTGA